MTSPNLPPLKGEATLDVSKFRQGIAQVQSDLRAVRDLAGQVGTIRLTADLSAGRDVQRAARAIRDAVEEAVPTDMQRRIAGLFGGFDVGVNSAAQSAAAFEARAASLRARIDELDRAVRITRANFQAGFGEASPEEINQLTERMRALTRELNQVGDVARREFGEYSREAQKVANANRLAETTAAAARGEITRLGLASQVKLGVGSALQQYGPQAMGAANGLFQFAQASDTARIAQGLFQKSVQKTGGTSEEAARVVAKLSDTLGVSGDAARDGIRGLLRQGYTLQQAYTALEGAGASALAAGRSAAEGMQGYVDAVTSGTSAALNQIGISENLFPFYAQYAKSIGKTTDELTRQDKVQAELLLIQKATSDEVADLIALQSGLGGAVNSTNRELSEAQKQLGESLVPFAVNGARALTRVLDVFNALPDGVQQTTTLLLASAVAVGVLYAPVSSLAVGLRGAWESLMKFGAASKAIDAATAAVGRLNVASRISEAGGFLPWVKSAPAALRAFTASTLAASGAQNVLSVAFLKTAGSTTILSGALGTLTLASAAALAGVGALVVGLGALWANQVKGTTAIYEQVDEANQKAFEQTMERVRQLMKGGTELGRAQARVLLIQQQLADAEQGTLVGTNFWTGERIYKRDEEAIKRLREQLVEARQNVIQLYAEAQRRGQLNVALTDEQTEAVKKLRATLEGKAFELRLEGMTDLQADLARLRREYEDLRREFKKPFVVNGKLMDPSQTPALRDGLAQLDAQQQAQAAAIRKRYADEAVKSARESALAVQQAEIEAMQGGAAKRQAQRNAEIAAIRRETAETVKALSDFPAQAAQVEQDGRRLIAARRRAWAQEDMQLARENAERVRQAQVSARDAEIAAMADGFAKQEALRRAALDDLRRDVAERVRLESDPATRAALQREGDRQIAALARQQQRERAEAIREGERTVLEAQRSARDASIAAMKDGYLKEVAVRQAALDDLRETLTRQIDEFQGTEEQRQALIREGSRRLLSEYSRYQTELRRIEQDNQRTVGEAQRSARAAEIAAIRDERARTLASRREELAEFRRQLAERLESFTGSEAQRQEILDAGRREERAKRQQWANEDEALARETARRIAQAWGEVNQKQFAAQQAARDAALARYNLGVSRRLAGAGDDPVARARIEGEAATRRAQMAQRAAEQQLAQERANLARSRDLALSAENLTAEERRAIWAQYYADLARLGADYQAGEAQRRQQQEEAERQAAENLRQARIEAAERPVQRSEGRIRELEQARELARSDAEVLQLDRLIAAERERQITLLQGQLSGLNGVVLTAQEREAVEARIRDLQHGQAVSLREQEEAGRRLAESALSRLEAEAGYAERMARSEAERLAAQRQQLGVLQARLRDLDDRIAGEGREAERNALIEQRFGLLVQIADLQTRIDAAPLDAERRRLDLYRAQAQAELTLRGLGEDRQAQADLTVQIAARELSLANAKVAAARTELELQAALAEQAGARAGLAQALQAREQAGQEAAAQVIDKQVEALQKVAEAERRRQEALARQLQLENALLDAAEARERALAQIRGMADDAVASAELELRLTRDRLALLERQLAVEGLGAEERAQLARERVQLLGQEAEGERKVLEAQRARRDLLENLAAAQAALESEARGGRELDAQVRATNGLAEARRNLAAAERAYQEARRDYDLSPSTGNAERLKSATEGLTGAIRGQREATVALLEAQQASVLALEDLEAAERNLASAQAGGRLAAEAQATRELTRTRRELARAEREYALARQMHAALPTTDNAERLKTATDTLTGAITAQREAVRGLAGAYRQQVSEMDGVREAADNLYASAYGQGDRLELARERQRQASVGRLFMDDAAFLKSGSIYQQQVDREISRLDAIAQRREAAQRNLADALRGGEERAIAQAANELAKQEKRYQEQAEMLRKNGIRVRDTGQEVTRDLADQVDALGIQYDAEAANLETRARLTEQEAENALTLSGAAQQFDESTRELVRALTAGVPLPAPVDVSADRERQDRAAARLESAVRDLTGAVRDVKAAGDAEAQRQRQIELLGEVAKGLREAKPSQISAESLDRLVERLVNLPPQPLQPGNLRALGREIGQAAGAVLAGRFTPPKPAPTPAASAPRTVPAGYSYTLRVDAINITAPSDRAADIERAARRALNQAVNEARRDRKWSGPKC
ncbi:hypothetical protein [Deinococcus murrayi]|uniref:hypothetical protein n=1 Tax=Deinococcus murrayi TaxID=68910 RepID=UPI00054D7D3E|nr:hypothetical protein [Deinococcus murrayi]